MVPVRFPLTTAARQIEADKMSTQTGNIRQIEKTSRGVPASDGDGVQLTRIIASPEIDMVDPFLLLDKFETDEPADYIGGFPPHPHRGFQTVTYLIAGRMRHKDNAGHEGVIEPGGVQWMSAARGIIHSEMPEQEDGLLQGFQLWINLPAANKMDEPSYQEFAADVIPTEVNSSGNQIKVIAGTTDNGTQGPVKNIITDPLYFDVQLAKDNIFTQSVPRGHNLVIYAIAGSLVAQDTLVAQGTLAVFGDGDKVEIIGKDQTSRFLFIAAKPLGEPVARGGPFVMNTKQEILQAFEDFKQGKF